MKCYLPVHRFGPVPVARLTIAGVFAAIFLSGCGGGQMPLYDVTGQVTLDGKPVTNAKVVFRPEVGPAANGTLDAEGRFELSTYSPGDGAVAGRHAVTIVPLTQGAVLEPGKPAQSPSSIEATPIPPKYQRAETSELVFEVPQDDNEFEIKLNN